MAAAYMAVRHVQGLAPGDVSKVDLVRKMPSDSDGILKKGDDSEVILKKGVLSRQIMSSSGVIYVKRDVVLTEKCIYFGKVGSADIIDFIPLLDIKQERGVKNYHVRGLDSPEASKHGIQNLMHQASNLLHSAKTVRLAHDQDRRAWMVVKQLNVLQTGWRICEVDSRRREIVNKKVPEPRMREPLANTLNETANVEGKVDQPSQLKVIPKRLLTEQQMLEEPGHKRLRFDDLSHILLDPGNSKVTVNFHDSSNQKPYEMGFLNSDERDDFLSVLKRNVQGLDVVDSADEQNLKQTKTWSRKESNVLKEEQSDKKKIAHLFFDKHLTIVIETIDDGHNHGRSTILMGKDDNEKAEWRSSLESAVQEARTRREKTRTKLGWIARARLKCRIIYSSRRSEYFFGGVIMASFLTSMSQYQPETKLESFASLKGLETFYAAIFTCELTFNLFANWWRPFARDAWNWL
jgi:hypothetical protein